MRNITRATAPLDNAPLDRSAIGWIQLALSVGFIVCAADANLVAQETALKEGSAVKATDTPSNKTQATKAGKASDEKPAAKQDKPKQTTGSIFDLPKEKNAEPKVVPGKRAVKENDGGIFENLAEKAASPKNDKDHSVDDAAAQTKTSGEKQEVDGEDLGGGFFDFTDTVVVVEAVDEPADADMVATQEVVVEEVNEAVVVEGFALAAQVNDPVFTKAMQHLTVRKGLARRCAELTEEQSEKLAKLNDEWMNQQIKELPAAAANNGLLMGVMRMMGAQPARPRQEPTNRVYKLIAKVEEAVKKSLDGPQLEAYEQELEASREFRKATHAAMYTTLFDHHIYMTEDDRTKLRAALEENLKAEDQIYFQFYFQNNQRFVPAIPAVTRKILSKEQMKILNGLNSYTYDALEWEMQMIPHQPLIVIEEE